MMMLQRLMREPRTGAPAGLRGLSNRVIRWEHKVLPEDVALMRQLVAANNEIRIIHRSHIAQITNLQPRPNV